MSAPFEAVRRLLFVFSALFCAVCSAFSSGSAEWEQRISKIEQLAIQESPSEALRLAAQALPPLLTENAFLASSERAALLFRLAAVYRTLAQTSEVEKITGHLETYRDPDIDLQLSDYYLWMGKDEKAISANKSALKKLPHRAPVEQARLFIGLSHNSAKAGKRSRAYEEALKAKSLIDSGLGTVSFSDRRAIDTIFQAANLFRVLGKSAEALRIYEGLTASSSLSAPDRTRARLALGDLLYEEDRLDESRRMYDQALIGGESFPEIHLKTGRAYIALEDYAKAISVFKLGLEQNPNGYQLWIELAKALALDGRHGEAKAAFESGKKFAKDQAEHIFRQGYYLFHLGDKDSAVDLFEEAVKDRPNDPMAHHHLARTYAAMGRTAEAIMIYKKSLALLVKAEPSVRAEIPHTVSQLSQLLCSTHALTPKVQEDELRELAQLTRELAEKYGFPMPDVLGDIYQKLGDPISAERYYREAIVNCPNTQACGHYQISLGRTLLVQGKRAEAKRLARSALALMAEPVPDPEKDPQIQNGFLSILSELADLCRNLGMSADEEFVLKKMVSFSDRWALPDLLSESRERLDGFYKRRRSGDRIRQEETLRREAP